MIIESVLGYTSVDLPEMLCLGFFSYLTLKCWFRHKEVCLRGH